MDISFLILIVALVGLMFFMSSRTRKQQREQQAFRSALAPGQQVMTGSGMVGTIVEIDEAGDTITIETTPGTQTRWLRAAIAKRIDTPAAEAPAEDADVAESGSPATIASDPDSIDVPDDLSDLDTAQREYREQQRRKDDETEGK